MSLSRRQLAAPAALVGAVAAATLAFFGTQAEAAPAPTTPTTAAGTPTTAAATPTPGAATPGAATPGAATPGAAPAAPPPAAGAAPKAPSYPASDVAVGRALFTQSCSSCHGLQAQGTSRAPTLTGLGAAAVDFWVSTGRMPLAVPNAQAVRKPPLYNPTQARQIAEYVASLAPGGPAIPSVDLSNTNLAQGGQLFRLNCATCHSFTGEGGALSYGSFAPALHQASPQQIAEAIRTGPGNMPRFGTTNISDRQMNDIISYVLYSNHPDNRGGFSLGNIGPVTEGFIGVGLGVGLMMLAAFWIGDRS